MTIKLVQQVIESLKFRHECRKGINMLMQLDDHMLQDIGISRYDIESTVKNQLRLKYCMRDTKAETHNPEKCHHASRILATASQ